jgi:hypothetical protein
MNNVFNINWSDFIRLLLPIALRQPRLQAWLRVLINPIETLHASFRTFRDESLYKLRHNSQIAYLENVLNDAFDNQLRRIRIANAVFKTPVYFYEPEENKEVFFYEPEDNQPVYFYEADDFAGDGFDFYVYVPPDIRPLAGSNEETNLVVRMQGLINYYKLYAKNYQIIWQELTED